MIATVISHPSGCSMKNACFIGTSWLSASCSARNSRSRQARSKDAVKPDTDIFCTVSKINVQFQTDGCTRHVSGYLKLS